MTQAGKARVRPCDRTASAVGNHVRHGAGPRAFAIALTLAGALVSGFGASGAWAGDVAAEAATIIKTRGCAACHYVPGIPEAVGTLGPSLKGLGSRDRIAGGRLENTPENMREWLTNPKAILSSTMMPNLGLEEAQIEVLIEYFKTL